MHRCSAGALACAVLTLTLACSPAAPDAQLEKPRELRVAVASNMQPAVEQLSRGFESEANVRVRLSAGSSGNFYAQIVNGAPFDLFISADTSYPQKLAGAGLSQPPITYAAGRLVIWTSKPDIPVAQLGMQSLLHLSTQRVAIANPEIAPYGAAAVAAMKHAGVEAEVRPKLVFGENVSQTAQFADTGAADVALIPLSLASVPPLNAKGAHWLVPQEMHPRIEQAAVVLKSSSDPQLARAFLDYLAGPRGRELLTRYGYDLPVPL